MSERVLQSIIFIAAVLLAAPVFAQDELSNDDREWMEDVVGPIITEEEKEIFQSISGDDRELFKELFWKRRDYDPLTPENEFREMYEKGIETADESFRSNQGPGSESDFAKVYLVLGSPSDEDRDQNGTTVTWTYDPNPAAGIPDGLTVQFRRQGQFGFRMVGDDRVEEALERARQAHITNDAVDYARDENGRLEDPKAGVDPGTDPAQLLSELVETGVTSDDLALQVNPYYFGASDGQVYVPIDIVFPGNFSGSSATVFYELQDAGGKTLQRFQENVTPSKGARGHLGYELPLQVESGTHKLYLGVVDRTPAYGSRIVDIEAPDFDDGEFKLSSIVMFSQAQQTGEANGEPGNAFLFGGYHFDPKREMVYTKSDHLSGVFNAYNFGTEGEKPNLTLQVSFFREDEPRGSSAEEPFLVQSPNFALTIFDFPLSIPNFQQPGNYRLELKVTDQTTQEVITEQVEFVIE